MAKLMALLPFFSFGPLLHTLSLSLSRHSSQTLNPSQNHALHLHNKPSPSSSLICFQTQKLNPLSDPKNPVLSPPCIPPWPHQGRGWGWGFIPLRSRRIGRRHPPCLAGVPGEIHPEGGEAGEGRPCPPRSWLPEDLHRAAGPVPDGCSSRRRSFG